jgi:hypothetical protein
MKNVYLIPTDKPSRLHLGDSGLVLCDLNFGRNTINGQNIYITSDEEIKDNFRGWFIGQCGFHKKCIDTKIIDNELYLLDYLGNTDRLIWCKKIILTTDQDLIKDGVQAIDDEFLEWFVKNPSCEWIEVKDSKIVKEHIFDGSNDGEIIWQREIIIPQEEPKQYPIGGYTPGFYSCTCVTCKEKFQGHKRAYQCEPCAIKMTQEEPKLINNCPKCGLDLVEREGCKPVCTRIDCGGIILSNETLKEWALKEEPKQYPSIHCDEACYYHCTKGGTQAPDCKKEETKQETIEEAAEKYARMQCEDLYDNEGLTGSNWGWETSLDFINGAKSNAAKEYWYKKFWEDYKNKTRISLTRKI